MVGSTKLFSDPPSGNCSNLHTGSSFFIFGKWIWQFERVKETSNIRSLQKNYKSVRKYRLTSKLTHINWIKQWESLYRSTSKAARKDNGHV